MMRAPGRQWCEPAQPDPALALLVERNHAEAFLAEQMVPGVEVHPDRDVVWIVHNGQAWRNAGILVRFSESSASRRLDTLLARYRRHRRGMALWVSPAATPDNLSALLHARGLRCRKHFPAMVRTLDNALRLPKPLPDGLEVRRVNDLDQFERVPYPAIGPLTTDLRRIAFDRLRRLLADRKRRTRALVAWLGGQPVGAIELFHGASSAGVHGLSVLDRYQGRGIASALLEQGCRDAREEGFDHVVLLATTDGQRLYQRRGFVEVARFGYWYRSFQRNTRAGAREPTTGTSPASTDARRSRR
jgi:GNAT superfamily N-acetyltransferase